MAVVSGHVVEGPVHPGRHVEDVIKMLAKLLQPCRWRFVSDTDLAEPKVELCTVPVELIGHGLGLQHLGGGPSEGGCSQAY